MYMRIDGVACIEYDCSQVIDVEIHLRASAGWRDDPFIPETGPRLAVQGRHHQVFADTESGLRSEQMKVSWSYFAELRGKVAERLQQVAGNWRGAGGLWQNERRKLSDSRLEVHSVGFYAG